VRIGPGRGEEQHEACGWECQEEGGRHHAREGNARGGAATATAKNAVVRTRLLAGALIVAVAGLDLAGAHGTAALVLVAAVPTAAGAALLSLGTALDGGGALDRVQAWSSGLALLLALVAAVLRTPLAANGDVPSLAASALTACLVVLAVQAIAGAAALRGRPRARFAIPAA